MIKARATEHLTGVTIEGTHDDLYEAVESIHRITNQEEDYKDPFWGVKNRLLGVCYDLRHAYMGDREVRVTDNGVNDEIIKWHSTIMPKQEVRFSVNVLFPEAVFVALSAPDLYVFSRHHYGKRTKRQEEKAEYPNNKYADYLKDRAAIDTLSSAILGALADVITDVELEKIINSSDARYYSDRFYQYATQYVDKCNIEYLKTPVEKRKDKIRNIAKRLYQQPDAYKNMKRELEHFAKLYNCSIHELNNPDLEYPEDIEW